MEPQLQYTKVLVSKTLQEQVRYARVPAKLYNHIGVHDGFAWR